MLSQNHRRKYRGHNIYVLNILLTVMWNKIWLDIVYNNGSLLKNIPFVNHLMWDHIDKRS